jgi:hypothetical protein
MLNVEMVQLHIGVQRVLFPKRGKQKEKILYLTNILYIVKFLRRKNQIKD